MGILYPLQSLSSNRDADTGESITVLVSRVVHSGMEASLIKTLRNLLHDFDRFPGTSGSMVFSRKSGNEVEFSILQRFANQSDHDAWLQSPDFARWQEEVAPPTPTPGHIHRYSGMESFFVSRQAPDAPPRWKMAVILLIAVYPMSLALSHWIAPVLASMPLLSGTLLVSVLMVIAMTYILVPMLTKIFERWLNPKAV